jgi:hypothetical protein
MIRSARAFAEKGELPSVLTNTIPWNRIHASTVIFPNDRTWKEEVPLNPDVALKA